MCHARPAFFTLITSCSSACFSALGGAPARILPIPIPRDMFHTPPGKHKHTSRIVYISHLLTPLLCVLPFFLLLALKYSARSLPCAFTIAISFTRSSACGDLSTRSCSRRDSIRESRWLISWLILCPLEAGLRGLLRKLLLVAFQD